MNNTLQDLETLLHEEIPITQQMGIGVVSYDGDRLVLQAPLSPNMNHKNTAFGGSLYSVAVLSGWGLLLLKLREYGLQGRIVIAESSISYRQPVRADFQASCSLPSFEEFSRFRHQFKQKRKARIQLTAEIWVERAIAVSFQGTYVVHT